jgi:hypothetical protein
MQAVVARQAKPAKDQPSATAAGEKGAERRDSTSILTNVQQKRVLWLYRGILRYRLSIWIRHLFRKRSSIDSCQASDKDADHYEGARV